MNRNIAFVFMMMAALFSVKVYGKWVSFDASEPGTPPEIQIIESHGDRIVFLVTVHGFFEQTVSNKYGTFRKVSIPDAVMSGDIGGPGTPRLAYRIAIPYSAGVQARELKRSAQVFRGYRLFPVQPPTLDTHPNDTFVFNEKNYTSKVLFPPSPLFLSDPVIWRDVRCVNVFINPVFYAPKDQTIDVASKITFEVTFDQSPSINVKRSPGRAVTPALYRMYQSSLVNFSSSDIKCKTLRDDSIAYLIIASDDLVASVQALADWWTRAGLKTEIKPVSEAGSTADDIKSMISDYYYNEGTEYVLLVGELEDIPVWDVSVSENTGIGDYDYGCIEGSDWYPEVSVGRILTDSPETVSHVVDRTLNYILSSPCDGWLEKSILCAHEEDYPGKYTQCKNEIRDFDYSIQTPIFETYYPPEGATHEQVVSAIEEGRGIINYRGHGGATQWLWSLNWTISDIYGLDNGLHVPIVWNICCDNAHIDLSGETICEAWQNAGANGEGGAVANLGATRGSFTIENHVFDKTLYKAVFDQGVTHIGHVVDVSRIAMIDMGDSGLYNARIYMLFGDPALDISTDDPMTMDVDHAPTIPIGESTFEVQVRCNGSPMENALVCIQKDDEYYGSAYTGPDGRVLLDTFIPNMGIAELTVTSHNCQPYMADITVEPTGCGSVSMNRNHYNCSDEVLINVWDADLNIDPLAPDTATVDISSDSDPAGKIVTLTETEVDSGSFSGQIATSSTSGPDVLVVNHDDTIVCIYHDADCDGAPRDVSDSAAVDCQSPVISNIIFDDLDIDHVVIRWQTDEASTSKIMFGPDTPPENIVENHHLVTDHQVLVSDLSQCMEYYFSISSTDKSGNTATDDNGGEYYSLTTLQQITVCEWPMTSDPGWTLDGDWAWGQPSGVDGDPASGFTGTYVVGYNLNGAYGNNMATPQYATTPSFDCSNASVVIVHFYRWLGVESSTYDHASFECSNDNGITWNTIWEHTGSSLQAAEWTYIEYDISDEAAGHSNVRLRWKMGPTDGSVVYCGWNIDDVVVECSMPCSVPYLTYDSHQVDDTSGGNGNGEINSGETIDLSLSMHNEGLDATGISAEISTDNPHITFQNSSSNFPDIPAGSNAGNLTDYIFTVGDDVTDGETITFNVTWTTAKTSGTFTFSDMIKSPDLTIAQVTIMDASTGDGDNVLDPGEEIYMSISLQNNGHGYARNISADLSCDAPEYITISDAQADFPDIPFGESATCHPPYFHIEASDDTPEHTRVTFTLTLSADGYAGQDTFDVDITTSTFAKRYYWNMDSDPDWTCEGEWRWGQPEGNDNDPSSGYTGENVYGYNLSGSYSNNMAETYLTSTPIDCSNLSNVEVRFMRWLGIESSNYDHASFRVSNDGTAWTTVWNHVSDSFTDPDWQAMTYDISSVADGHSTVYLRWVMGDTDSSVTDCGWNIDDVEIWGEFTQTQPTPTSTPSPAPTDTPLPTFTDTPTPIPTATPEPPPADMGMTLFMDDTDLEAGDLFHLYFVLGNPSSHDYRCDAYLLLDVYGTYWCWPSWVPLDEDLDYETYTVKTGTALNVEVLSFEWPSVENQAEGLSFIGCAFDSGTWNIIGDVTSLTWRYH